MAKCHMVNCHMVKCPGVPEPCAVTHTLLLNTFACVAASAFLLNAVGGILGFARKYVGAAAEQGATVERASCHVWTTHITAAQLVASFVRPLLYPAASCTSL
jgi:hypothetical protein